MIRWLIRLFGKSRPAGPADTRSSDSTKTDTEFTAEVVRVVSVSTHPNADKLEIAKFELHGVGPTTYEVVIQKGSFKPGDLAAYFSVDCILPTSHPDFSFLKTRLDGAGKTHYRLRAARLRGVFSQGLLVGAPDTHAFGDRVDETFGVTYYRPPEPGQPSQPSSKPPRVQPCPVYGVESLKKVPRLFAEGERVQVTEKIHGCNFRFGWVRRRGLLGWLGLYHFVVGSHRVIKDGTSGGFYGEDLWTTFAEDHHLAALTADHKGLVFYGELFGYTWNGTAIQDLTYGRRGDEGPALAVFDVLQTKPQRWLSAEERHRLLTDLRLPAPPVLYEGPFSPSVLSMAEGKSVVPAATKQIREGVVVESLEGPRRKAKYVGEGYLTRKGA